MKRQFQIGLVFLCALANLDDLQACVCDSRYSLENEFKQADAVFVGEVMQVTHEEDLFIRKVPLIGDLYCGSNNCWSKVVFSVEQSWKGTGIQEGNVRWDVYCRWPLDVGDRMLMFAQFRDGDLSASCGLSDLANNREKEIRNLGPAQWTAAKIKTDDGIKAKHLMLLLGVLCAFGVAALFLGRRLQRRSTPPLRPE